MSYYVTINKPSHGGTIQEYTTSGWTTINFGSRTSVTNQYVSNSSHNFKYVSGGGYSFDYWTVYEIRYGEENEFTSRDNYYTVSDDGSLDEVTLTVTEKVTPATTYEYSVVKDPINGGTATINNGASFTDGAGSQLVLRAVANTDFRFVRWRYRRKNIGSYTNLSTSSEYTVQSSPAYNTQYQAVFSNEYEYYLYYNSNDGGGTFDTDYATSPNTSYSFNIITSKPTRSGYFFYGWSTNPSATPGGSSRIYEDSESIMLQHTSGPATQTLYAVWVREYTVIFAHGTGGTTSENSIAVPANTQVSVSDDSIYFYLEKSDSYGYYILYSQYVDANASSGYAPNGWTRSSGSLEAPITSNNITFTAQFIKVYEMRLRFFSNGGSGSVPANQTYRGPDSSHTFTIPLTPTPTPPTGKHFDTWRESTSPYTAHAPGSTITIAGVSSGAAIVDLYAYYEDDKFTVNFTVNSGQYGSVNPTSISDVPWGSEVSISGSTVSLRDPSGYTPQRVRSSVASANESYILSRWERSSGSLTDNITSANVTFTAVFGLRPYTVGISHAANCSVNTDNVSNLTGSIVVKAVGSNLQFGATTPVQGSFSSGFEMDYWLYTSPSSQQTRLYPGDQVTIDYAASQSFTLYAKASLPTYSYQVQAGVGGSAVMTYNGQPYPSVGTDSEQGSRQSVIATQGDTISYSATPLEGSLYRFEGWRSIQTAVIVEYAQSFTKTVDGEYPTVYLAVFELITEAGLTVQYNESATIRVNGTEVTSPRSTFTMYVGDSFTIEATINDSSLAFDYWQGNAPGSAWRVYEGDPRVTVSGSSMNVITLSDVMDRGMQVYTLVLKSVTTYTITLYVDNSYTNTVMSHMSKLKLVNSPQTIGGITLSNQEGTE